SAPQSPTISGELCARVSAAKPRNGESSSPPARIGTTWALPPPSPPPLTRRITSGPSGKYSRGSTSSDPRTGDLHTTRRERAVCTCSGLVPPHLHALLLRHEAKERCCESGKAFGGHPGDGLRCGRRRF